MSKILTEPEFYTSYVGDSALYEHRQDGLKKIAKVSNFKDAVPESSYLNGVDVKTITDETVLSKTITDSDNILGYLQINRNRNVNNSFFLASSIFDSNYNTDGFDVSNSPIISDVTVYSNDNLTCNIPISVNTNVLTYDLSGENINTTKIKLGSNINYYLYGFNNLIIIPDNNSRYIKIQLGFAESSTTSVYAEGQRSYSIILYDGNQSTSQPIAATENIEVELYITYSEETKSLWKYMSNNQNIYDYSVKLNLYTGESSKTLTESQYIYKNEEGDEEYVEPDVPIDITSPGPIPTGVSMTVTNTSDINYHKYTGRDKLLEVKAYRLIQINNPKAYNQTIEL